MQPVMDVARQHGIPVVEDGALAVGAEYRGRKVGTFGVAGAFSLAPSKILGGLGDGGVVATDDATIADRLRVLRNYGHDPEMDRYAGATADHPWRVVSDGWNERLDPVQAAVLRTKLPTLDAEIERRRAIAAQYSDALEAAGALCPVEPDGHKHVYRGYGILVENRAWFQRELAARGIASRRYYNPPLHLQPAYATSAARYTLPVAERVGEQQVYLPIFPAMKQEEVTAVIEASLELLGHGARAELPQEV
jgi:dTDP-4-amino-4,6-dideoxygalactose transaminase